MAQSPYLLKLEAVQDSLLPDKATFRDKAYRNFGLTADYLHSQPELKQPEPGELRSGIAQRAMCGEMLLMPLSDRLKLETLIDNQQMPITLNNNEGPVYAEVKRLPVAAALFPLCGVTPEIGRVWVIKDGGTASWHRTSAFRNDNGLYAAAKARGCSLFVETPFSETDTSVRVDGPSWQLAAWLALLTVCDYQSEHVIRLASRWIATGEVEEPHIRAVKIGNKPAVSIEREWLIPGANAAGFRSSRSDAASEGKEIRFYTPGTLSEAYNLVCGGIRIQVGKPEQLPSRIDELHIVLAGDSISLPDDFIQRTHIRHLRLYDLGLSTSRLNEMKQQFPDNVYPLPKGNDIDRCTDLIRSLAQRSGPREIWVDITNLAWPLQAAIETQVRHCDIRLLWRDPSTQRYCKYWYRDYLPMLCDLDRSPLPEAGNTV